jgi:hypothetical protein
MIAIGQIQQELLLPRLQRTHVPIMGALVNPKDITAKLKKPPISMLGSNNKNVPNAVT